MIKLEMIYYSWKPTEILTFTSLWWPKFPQFTGENLVQELVFKAFA